jgi:hypothetical protein
VASYSVNPDGVAWARHLIEAGQYVLDSDWSQVQPRASAQNAFLKSHSWPEYARWHLGLTDGARERPRRATERHVVKIPDYYEYTCELYESGILNRATIISLRGQLTARTYSTCEQYITEIRKRQKRHIYSTFE